MDLSLVIPLYNEEENVRPLLARVFETLSQLDLDWEVIVVDDGSTDGTAGIVRALRLPNVRVIEVPNGGKAGALNIGIAAATHEIIIMVDADTVFERDSIRELVQPLADATVGAVSGNVKVSNRRGLLGAWQHIEYVIGFNLDRRLYEALGCMPTVPGAIGAYRRRVLREVGGVSRRTLAEDTDLTMAIIRAGWRVVYEPKAIAHTEAPVKLRQLWKQRYRWSYGTMQAMWIHRAALLDSGSSGRFGRIGLPLLTLFGIVLPLLAPLVDVLTIFGVLFLNRGEAGLAWLAMLALQFLTAVIAFRLDGEPLRGVLALPFQQVAYRQLLYLVMVKSVATALTGAQLRWQKLHRLGAAAAHRQRAAAAVRPELGRAAGRDRASIATG